MSTVFTFALLGLGLGALYALAAQGVVLIYRGSGTINFAQGAMGMVGAFVFYTAHYTGGGQGAILTVRWPFWPSFVLGILAGAACGIATHLFVMRPLRHASAIAPIIGTLGVLTIIQSFAILRWGDNSIFLPSYLPSGVIHFSNDVAVSEDRLLILLIAAIASLALWVVFRYHRFGLATTATAENPESSAALGWSPDKIGVINWGLGGALGALAGILFIPIIGLNVTDLTNVVMAALAAALVGRFVSFPVTLLAALTIGVVQSELTNYVTQVGISTSVPFFVVILWLSVRGASIPVRGYLAERQPTVGTGRVTPRALVIAGILGLASVLLTSGAWLSAVTFTLIVGTILLSFVVLTGYAGQISLGQYAIAGTGAFIAGRLVSALGVPFDIALIIGVLGTVPIGLLFAIPALRNRGAQLAIVTLGLGLAINAIVFSNGSFTGGYQGTIIGPNRTFFGIDINPVAHPKAYAVFCLAWFAITGIVIANVRRGRVGRRLLAVRVNERAAASLGISVTGAKLFAFGLASAIAALGGILLAFQSTIIVYSQFDNFESITFISFAVIGGIGYIGGSLLGAQFAAGAIGTLIASKLFPGPEVQNYIPLVGGLVLILILVSHPDGLASQKFTLLKRLGLSANSARHTVVTELPDDSTSVEVPGKSLQLEDLTVRFGGVLALDHLALTVSPGKITGLIGPNGAGKTTAIDAITGFVRSSGSVKLNSVPIEQQSVVDRARNGVTRSFQSLELFEELTVLENIQTAADKRDQRAYFTGLLRPGNPPLPKAAVAAIREFDLADDLDRRPSDLSFGKRRLVAIARAVATLPSVLLLDEPAAGLDEGESRELARLVRRLADHWGMSILLIEHDMTFVMSVCDRITVLDFGRRIAEGTPSEVQSDTAVVEAYLGVPSSSVADPHAPDGAKSDGTPLDVTSTSDIGAR